MGVGIWGHDLFAGVEGMRMLARVLAVFVTHVVQDLTSQLNVVVCELADFSIVDSEDLCFFGSAEGESWDEVHNEEDETGTEEGVCAS